MGRQGATISEVAQRAGVAASTVSRYLNGKLKVAPATEARLLAAVRDLGYAGPARSRIARRGVIGLVAPQLSNPYYGAIADQVVETAQRHGRLVLVCSTGSQVRGQSDYVELLASGTIDGLLYCGSYRSNSRLGEAIKDGLQVVVVDEPIAGLPPVDSVVMDDYAGGYQAASYLTALGHRRIAFVTGPAELGSVQERLRGYRDALNRAGISPDAQVALFGQFTEQFGMSALPHLLAAAQPPTAVFAAGDRIAIGVLSAAEANGIDVPARLSVVGFGDIRPSQYVRPRLTTIRAPLARLAGAGAELLFERLDGLDGPARMQVLPVELIIRESAAGPG